MTSVWGVQYGYEGFYSTKMPPKPLTADIVKNLHDIGGTVLGSSRGASSPLQLGHLSHPVLHFARPQETFLFSVDGERRLRSRRLSHCATQTVMYSTSLCTTL